MVRRNNFMSKNSKIQWCHHTFNYWRGCRKVAPECLNCYITTTPPFRISGQTHGAVRVRSGNGALSEPLKWNAKVPVGERHRVFCLSLGDWLDDENVPIEWLAGLLSTIEATPNLDWLLLTKRPQNWRTRLEAATWRITPGLRAVDDPAFRLGEAWLSGRPPENVWIGVSAGADQAAALSIPARIHFLSC